MYACAKVLMKPHRQQQQELADLLNTNRHLSNDALQTGGITASYQAALCSEGYTGPLCGSCMPKYGRKNFKCVECGVATTSIIFFLLCLYMFVLVLVAGIMHVKQTDQRFASLDAALEGHTSQAAHGASKFPSMQPLGAEAGFEKSCAGPEHAGISGCYGYRALPPVPEGEAKEALTGAAAAAAGDATAAPAINRLRYSNQGDGRCSSQDDHDDLAQDQDTTTLPTSGSGRDNTGAAAAGSLQPCRVGATEAQEMGTSSTAPCISPASAAPPAAPAVFSWVPGRHPTFLNKQPAESSLIPNIPVSQEASSTSLGSFIAWPIGGATAAGGTAFIQTPMSPVRPALLERLLGIESLDESDSIQVMQNQLSSSATAAGLPPTAAMAAAGSLGSMGRGGKGKVLWSLRVDKHYVSDIVKVSPALSISWPLSCR